MEIFNSYGKRPNNNLLLDYGFVLLDNEWDEISLIPILEKNHIFTNRTKELLSLSKTYWKYDLLLRNDNKFPLKVCYNPSS